MSLKTLLGDAQPTFAKSETNCNMMSRAGKSSNLSQTLISAGEVSAHHPGCQRLAFSRFGLAARSDFLERASPRNCADPVRSYGAENGRLIFASRPLTHFTNQTRQSSEAES